LRDTEPERRTRRSGSAAMAKRHPNRRPRAYQHLHAAFPLALPLADAAIRPLALASRDELAA
jgi:hypothetical protein